MDKSFNDFCKMIIKNRLPDLSGLYFYGSELHMEITSEIFENGSITNSLSDAQSIAVLWFDDLKKYLEFERKSNGANAHSVLKETELFLVSMVSYGVQSILKQSMLVYCNWDIEFHLSDVAISKITRQIDHKIVRF